ncbi:hypothetical protein ACPC5Q_08860 [Acinetobacter junii]|uniref:hypothetical protein n=1 Tax=Acinetobacter junii TaxID=40215 RepID=UPI003C139AB4
MNNYKIKVNDEAESKEAQELFFEMGYKFEFCADIQSCRQSEAFSFPYFVQATEFGQIIFAIGQLEKAKELTLHQLRYLVAQIKNEQGLISGADALRAIADGKEVEYFSNADYTWKSIFKYHPSLETIANNEIDINHKFRLKPRTIKLELEIPAPFEPKVGEKYWFIADYVSSGYSDTQEGTGINSSIGKWRTEEEIKQVVAALRGGIKG